MKRIRNLLIVVMILVNTPGLCAAEVTKPPPLVVATLAVEISGVHSRRGYYEEIARGLIPIQAGDPFSADTIRAAIDALKRSDLFESIEVPDPDWSAQRLTLTFRLTPFRRIKDIKLSGAFPLLEKEVFNAMTIFTGDAFVPSSLPRQKALIIQLFQEEGYPDPQVVIIATQAPGDDHVVVAIAIDKGSFNRIQRVEMHGNRSFSDTRLKLRTDTWKSSLFYGEIPRFVEKKRREDVKRLIHFYRTQGYAEVEVSSTVTPIPGTYDVVLRFEVREGPRYTTRFKRNKEFWDWTLKRTLNLEGRGNRDDIELKRGIRAIRKRYREAGYLDTRVRMAETPGQKEAPTRHIQFTIIEGPRAIVDAIHIEGNTVFPLEALEKEMFTRLPGTFHGGAFVPKILKEDISAMEALYLKQGYLNISITDTVTFRPDPKGKRTLTDIRLTVSEGPQTRIKSIEFKGLNALTDAEARNAIALREGAPFREYMVQSDENTLSERISEKGHPHVAVSGTIHAEKGGSEDTTCQWAGVTYELDEGPPVKMGETFYTGNFRTQETILKKELTQKPGAPFSLIKMLESQRNIRNINALDSANFTMIGLAEKTNRVQMMVEVEEKKPYYVEAGLGYDTRREIYTHARLGDRNLFGLNKEGWVASEWSEIGYRAELGLTDPRFLETRIASTFNLFAEDIHEFNQNFGTRTYGASLGLTRDLTPHIKTSLISRYERRDLYQEESDPVDLDALEQYEPRSLIVTTPSIFYRSTDSFIRPKKGAMATAALEISKGIETPLDDFLKHRYELRSYYSPTDRLTLAFRGRYQHVAPYGGVTTIAEDQRLFLGGTSDIRGFGENMLRVGADGDPVGGRTSILGSLEARFDVGLHMELTTFYDTGALLKLSDTTLPEGFRSSAGAGLRYITPIGPIGFLYGWKLDPKPGESAGSLHFSIGYTF